MKAVNLLPSDLRSASRRAKASGAPRPEAAGGSGPFVVLGVLAMCVVALAGYVLASNTVKDREAKLASVTLEHAAAVRRAAELKPYGTFQELASRRIQGVSALASQRFDWERALGDLSQAMPTDVTLEGLTGSLAGGTSGGNALRAGISAPAIEIKGCTSAHTGVAELMSRLRTVRGVTRVSLSGSQKSEEAAASPTAGIAAPVGCGKADAPKFEIVMFFERSTAGAAPAAAAAGSTTPGAAPAPAAGPGTATATPSPSPAAGQPATAPATGTATAGQQPATTTTSASTTGATR